VLPNYIGTNLALTRPANWSSSVFGFTWYAFCKQNSFKLVASVLQCNTPNSKGINIIKKIIHLMT